MNPIHLKILCNKVGQNWPSCFKGGAEKCKKICLRTTNNMKSLFELSALADKKRVGQRENMYHFWSQWKATSNSLVSLWTSITFWHCSLAFTSVSSDSMKNNGVHRSCSIFASHFLRFAMLVSNCFTASSVSSNFLFLQSDMTVIPPKSVQ